MASATSVTSVSYVPFRRFLPHEKQTAQPVTHQDYHNNNYEADDDSGNDMPGMPQPILSNEDVSVLIEAGHPEDDGIHEKESIDTLYLPFTFSLAAQQ
jgi:hypothetical protein